MQPIIEGQASSAKTIQLVDYKALRLGEAETMRACIWLLECWGLNLVSTLTQLFRVCKL